MKHTMKTALALLLTLAMMLVPMSIVASAESGTYEDPYLLSTTSVRFYVYVQPEETAYIQVDDCNGSTVAVGYATADTYMMQYGRQTIYPNGDADNTASFTMNTFSNMFSVYNTGTEAISVYMSLTSGAPADTTGTMDNPEVLTFSDPWGMGFLSASAEIALEAGNDGRYYKVVAPADGVINVSPAAYDSETYDSIGWMYFVHNITQGKYGSNHWSDEEPVVDAERVEVQKDDEVIVFVATYNPENMFANPAGTVSVYMSFSAIGSYDCPVEAVVGDNEVEIAAGSNGYYYVWTAPEGGYATVTINNETDWQYRVDVVPADEEDYGAYVYGDTHWSDDEVVVPSETVYLKTGDTIKVWVSTYDPNSFNTPAGTIDWTFAFEAGAPAFVKGDASADGMFGVNDILLMLDVLNDMDELDEAGMAAADLNGNGAMDFTDVVRAFYALNGMIEL